MLRTAAAAAVLLAPALANAEFDLFGTSKPQPQESAQPPIHPKPAPAQSAQPPIRATPAPVAAAKPAAQNRVNPVRRKGKEGVEDAKIDADQARELYLRRKLRLEQIKAEQRDLVLDKRALAANRARMHARLIETARALRLSEKRLSEIEQRLAETRAKVKERREKLADKSGQLSELFILMQGMSRQPPPMIITHSRDALAMIRSGMILATFYGDVEHLAAQLSAEVAELETAEKEAELQEQRRRAEQVQNSRLKAQIDLLLIENREQLAATASNLESLKTATQINLAGIKSLEEMMPMLDAAVPKGTNPGAAVPAKGMVTAMALSQGTAPVAPAGMTPSIPFARAQGLLPLPVQGKMLIRFGETDRYGVASKGIHIEARPGAQVISPCDGWILYAGPFRSYGQLLIINTGGGYHVVLAGMDRIQAMQGQFVLAGEPVAVMGSETRTAGTLPARPTLYVEFRKDQQSIDPAPWWSAGAGKG